MDNAFVRPLIGVAALIGMIPLSFALLRSLKMLAVESPWSLVVSLLLIGLFAAWQWGLTLLLLKVGRRIVDLARSFIGRDR